MIGPPPPRKEVMVMSEQCLDHASRKELVFQAWSAIQASVRRETGPAEEILATAQRACPALASLRGAFVTIYVEEQLRGCLGEIEPEDALIEVVVRCARNTARSDYRFAPINAVELDRVGFKISVLSPPQPLQPGQEIRIGTHGLIARHLGQSGLLLPDVPVEYGWDTPTFFKQLWRKAGIDPQVAISEVSLWTFTSEIIPSEDFLPDGTKTKNETGIQE